jgi:hypothetical protein
MVRTLLANPRYGGRGLRAWVGLMEAEDRPLPPALPAELVDVYLRDDEAEPLYDCEACGLAVPVRVGWRSGHEPAYDRVYFPAWPPHVGDAVAGLGHRASPRPRSSWHGYARPARTPR